ncbi:MAG: PBP1A family penicillin-binding protein [Pseudomonadota bacterium]
MRQSGHHSGKWLIAVIVASAVAAGITAGASVALFRDLPQIRGLEHFSPDAITRIYSAEGQLLAELYAEHRQPVGFKDIPAPLIAALVATEDRQFYQHGGVDLKGIARALVKDILAGEFIEGASTITQQLSKTLFLTPEKNLMRKLREAVLSLQIERRYTKNEIITLYLNQVYFGSGAYGIAAAAGTFFGKSVEALTLAECALIAGMPKAPSVYTPLVNPALAVKRRNMVLRQMVDTGAITTEAYQQAAVEPLTLGKRQRPDSIAPYFIDFIRPALESAVGTSAMYSSGMSVHTTIQSKLQKAANTAVQAGLAELAERMRRNRVPSAEPQAALVALNVPTGAVIAMVGGTDYAQSSYNRATVAQRQPGSAFKPILYAYAISQGYPQNTLLLDAPVAYDHGVGDTTWLPDNFSTGVFEGDITFRWALAKSKNIPAVRLMDIMGPSAVADFARRLGIQSPLRANLSLALGTSEATLLDLTTAYTVFASGGKHVTPYGITSITDRDGRTLWQGRPQSYPVLDRLSAAVVTDMLSGVISEGTGQRAAGLGRPLAGKTGTTNDYRDALFVGFSPATTVGVWVGQDDNTALGPYETGAKAALPIWTAFMAAVLETEPVGYFDVPDGTTHISIDPVTGVKRPDGAVGSVRALFRTADLGKAFPPPHP